ncbi:MAG: lipid A deacylase LpxR family protein [Gammaproteobacteria bacterium]|nr:lipid A deacylase LpxR family protein [Gammaproteobacteria bacterium]
MASQFCKLTVLATGLLISTLAFADRDQTENWTLNLYWENDLFSQTDLGYTNGARASWVSPDLGDYINDPALPDWMKSVNKGLAFFNKVRTGQKRNVIFSVGHNLFTPEDFTRSDLIEDDRPYAGWLFTSFGYQTRNDAQLDTLEATFGVVGPAALGQQVQDVIHDARNIERFAGWDNQLGNEFGFIFLWEHKKKFSHEYDPVSRFGFDLIGHSGIALGNVRTYLNIGAEVRLGWAIPDDFGTSALRPGGDNSTPDAVWDPRARGGTKWGAHAFISFDSRISARNIFLDGNTFKDSHAVDRKIFVTEGALGISVMYGGYNRSYAHIFRSKEFALQPHTHSYGSLAFSYTFR